MDVVDAQLHLGHGMTRPTLEAMDALREEITGRGGVFALARVKQDLLGRLRSFGLADTIGTERMFPTLPTAVAAYQEWAARQEHRPGPARGTS